MNCWYGVMDWPLDEDWKCGTCGSRNGLTWGLQHAVCRCNLCHTQYYMRDGDGKATSIPQCMLKDEYKEPAKRGFEKFQVPLSQWDDKAWDAAIALVEEGE